MNDMMILGAVAPWVTWWLTPIWVLSVGVTVGLLACLLVWGVLAGLSRIPAVANLGTNPQVRKSATWIGTAITFAAYAFIGYWTISRKWGSGDLGPNLLIGFLLLIPVCYLVPRALIMLVTRRSVREVPEAIREGVLWPLLWVAIGFTIFTGLGLGLIRNPGEFARVLGRWAFLSSPSKTVEIPPSPEVDLEHQKVDISFLRHEVSRIDFTSTENIEVRARSLADDLSPDARLLEVTTRDTQPWIPNPISLRTVFPLDKIDALYIANRGSNPAKVTITVQTQPSIPEVLIIPVAAATVVSVFLIYLMQRSSLPRLSAVALATVKSEMAQPLFVILVIMGVVALVVFIVIPGNTFGEDIKILKDSGMTLIKILAVFQAVWAAGVSVAEEIEGRTALTVLSKPINRRSFIFGKFLGITWTVALMYAILGSVFLLTVAYKPIYDAREGAVDDPTWQICFWQMVQVIPGLVLAFMETIVLAAISVAISTRLPMMANFTITFTVYLLGNLAPLIVASSEKQFAIVKFFAQLIATVFPNLENFNTYAAIAGGKEVPPIYMAGAGLYCLIFTGIAMLLALILFEDRDLA